MAIGNFEDSLFFYFFLIHSPLTFHSDFSTFSDLCPVCRHSDLRPFPFIFAAPFNSVNPSSWDVVESSPNMQGEREGERESDAHVWSVRPAGPSSK